VAIYSIRDLEKLSGIKAHTIRIWEQRYSLIQPKRTQSNIRYYDDENLRLLLNIALLNKNGMKISNIANLSHDEICKSVSSVSDIMVEQDNQLDALTIAMISMDEFKFDRIISTSVQQMGFERTMLEVVYPFLERLTLLWITGSLNTVHEHFMSHLLRQKVIAAIDREPLSISRDTKKFMIYLPQGEKQELSLLFLYYLLKVRKNFVIYLGLDVTLPDLKEAAKVHKPDYIFTFVNEPLAKMSVQSYVESVANTFPDSHLLISGFQIVNKIIRIPTSGNVLNSLVDTIEFLDDLQMKNLNRIPK